MEGKQLKWIQFKPFIHKNIEEGIGWQECLGNNPWNSIDTRMHNNTMIIIVDPKNKKAIYCSRNGIIPILTDHTWYIYLSDYVYKFRNGEWYRKKQRRNDNETM